jgi:hypothetical protein
MDRLSGQRVGQCKRRGDGANGSDPVFNSCLKQSGGCGFGDGEAVGLDESPCVLSDAVELVLKRHGLDLVYPFARAAAAPDNGLH